jgi:hypothetical protein
VVRAKTWLVIPALALAAAALGLAARQSPETSVMLGALGAALAAAVRAFTGPSIAAAVAATAASLLGVLAMLELAELEVARASLACAAGMFAIAELVRPMPTNPSPWPALGAALVAMVVDPTFAPLFVVAGVRYVTGPWPQPRWALLVPATGVLAVALAAITATLHPRSDLLAQLWSHWAARGTGIADPLAMLGALGDLLGPVTAVVALAGLGTCAARGRIQGASVLGVAGGALAIDLATGVTGGGTVICAALGAGVGIARFAAMIRWPVGQAFVGGVVGVMLVVAPVWALADAIF